MTTSIDHAPLHCAPVPVPEPAKSDSVRTISRLDVLRAVQAALGGEVVGYRFGYQVPHLVLPRGQLVRAATARDGVWRLSGRCESGRRMAVRVGAGGVAAAARELARMLEAPSMKVSRSDGPSAL